MTDQIDGHVAGAASSIGPIEEDLHHILQGSMKDCYYMSKETYLEETKERLTRWLKTHALPSACTEQWTEFLEQQWPQHLQAVTEEKAMDFSKIAQLKQILRPVVAHCEDHMATKLCVYCPKMYHRVLKATFNNKEVFREEPIGPIELQDRLPLLLSPELAKKYAWGFSKGTKLPSCYIFPKAKKNYQKARPVITFDDTYARTLSQYLAAVLTQMCKIAYPDNLRKDSTQGTFDKLHGFLKKLPSNSTAWKFHNDDLVGFFT
jgi:hypothetical protein